MRNIITVALSAGALVLPLAACSSAGTASVPSSAATVSIPAPESSAQQAVQQACSDLDTGAQVVRSATPANIVDSLGALYGDIENDKSALSGKIGADFDTLIGELNSAYANNRAYQGGPLPIAAIQAALNQALADC